MCMFNLWSLTYELIVSAILLCSLIKREVFIKMPEGKAYTLH